MAGHYVQQSWTPSSFATYRSAVEDEGKETLCVVTEYLYTGGNTRPDMYFKSKFGVGMYRKIFNTAQQSILENSDGLFNIRTAVEDYDISLNILLQKYLCGLAPKRTREWYMQGTLENMLNQVHDRRNDVVHNSRHMSEYQLKEELLNLQELYGDILDQVDRRTYQSIDSDRQRIIKSLKDKFPDEDDQDTCFGNQIMNRMSSNAHPSYCNSNSRYVGRSNSTVSSREEEAEESGIPTFGKIALGVAGAAVAAWGVSKIVKKESSEQEKREKQKSSNEEECSIM